jgi:hypothetical protein
MVCKTGNGRHRLGAGSRRASRLGLSPRLRRRAVGRGPCEGRCCARSASAPIRMRRVCIAVSTSVRRRAWRWPRRRAASSPLQAPCRPAAGRSRSGRPTATPRLCFTSAPWPPGAVHQWPRERWSALSAQAACRSCRCPTCTSVFAGPPSRRGTSIPCFSCHRRFLILRLCRQRLSPCPHQHRPPGRPCLLPRREHDLPLRQARLRRRLLSRGGQRP